MQFSENKTSLKNSTDVPDVLLLERIQLNTQNNLLHFFPQHCTMFLAHNTHTVTIIIFKDLTVLFYKSLNIHLQLNTLIKFSIFTQSQISVVKYHIYIFFPHGLNTIHFLNFQLSVSCSSMLIHKHTPVTVFPLLTTEDKNFI